MLIWMNTVNGPMKLQHVLLLLLLLNNKMMGKKNMVM
jgi:hypothetical protein